MPKVVLCIDCGNVCPGGGIWNFDEKRNKNVARCKECNQKLCVNLKSSVAPCPKCNIPMKFTATMPMNVHGMCDFWTCPECKYIAIYNKDGQKIEKDG